VIISREDDYAQRPQDEREPPIGTARCLLAVMTAAGQNRLFGASGICRQVGPVPASYSLSIAFSFRLRFSPLHGLPLRAAEPA